MQVVLLSDGTAGETAVQEFEQQPSAEQLRRAIAIAQSAVIGPLFLPTVELDPRKVTVVQGFGTLQELNQAALNTPSTSQPMPTPASKELMALGKQTKVQHLAMQRHKRACNVCNG